MEETDGCELFSADRGRPVKIAAILGTLRFSWRASLGINKWFQVGHRTAKDVVTAHVATFGLSRSPRTCARARAQR